MGFQDVLNATDEEIAIMMEEAVDGMDLDDTMKNDLKKYYKSPVGIKEIKNDAKKRTRLYTYDELMQAQEDYGKGIKAALLETWKEDIKDRDRGKTILKSAKEGGRAKKGKYFVPKEEIQSKVLEILEKNSSMSVTQARKKAAGILSISFSTVKIHTKQNSKKK